MKYAVMGYATFTTTVKRDKVHTRVANAASTATTWGLTRNEASIEDGTGRPALYVEVRVLTRTEMIDLYNAAVAEAAAQGWLASSWFAYHECPHDEVPPRPCTVEQRTVA